jgi:type IV secretion system protein VirB9
LYQFFVIKRIYLKVLVTLILFYILPLSAYAIREPRPTAVDSRIRVMTYSPDDVYRYIGYYGFQANIEFAEDESIESVSMGDTTAWQIVPSGRRMFIKPIDDEATTNMTVITNKRMYYFELHAQEAQDINDPDMVFTVRFLYPDDTSGAVVRHFTASSEPDLKENPERFNFNYTISGDQTIAPVKIFDDGDFTYFQFKDKNTPIPAFFTVDKSAQEEIVNYRVAGSYIVIERVVSRFTLRYGKEVVCVFNEDMPI